MNIACREALGVLLGRAVRFTRRLHPQLRPLLCHLPRHRQEFHRSRDRRIQSCPNLYTARP